MEQHVLEMINSHIVRIENALKTDIQEIKSDLKELKESQIKLAEVIVKLGSVEDKYNIQLTICKDARKTIDSLKEKYDSIDKRLIPIENFYKHYCEVKNKLIVGISIAILSGLGALIINIIRMLN